MRDRKRTRVEEEELAEEENEAYLARRFDRLPLSTRRWLSGLRDEDIETLNEAIRFQEQAKTVGRFSKWLMISFAGAVILMAQFGQSLAAVIKFLFGKGS